MDKLIKLRGMFDTVSTCGKFLIAGEPVGHQNGYGFYNIETGCEFFPPCFEKGILWEAIETYDDVVILTAPKRNAPIRDGKTVAKDGNKEQYVFSKSKEEFLANPEASSDQNMIFNEVMVSGGIIRCEVKLYDIEKNHREVICWFDAAGNLRASEIWVNFGERSVRLRNGEEIDKVTRVEEVKDTKTDMITGLFIVRKVEGCYEDLFYPF